MEFSEDEKTLYVINLNDKKLYSVDMATQAVSVVTTIVDPGCTGGVSRPFALKMWRGKLYVGIICDASTTGHTITSNLKAFVYSLDLTTNVFTQVLNIPMDYLRSSAWNETAYGGASGMPVSSRFWYPWENNFVPANFGGYAGLVNGNTLQYKICHPSPILSDIEFDVDGGMILGFTDRTSHQFGDNNMAPDNIGRLETVISGGDILRASPNAATTLWTSETLTPYSATTTYTATTPAPTEYYAGEVFSRHNETAQGGLALLAGQGEVVTTDLDPFVFYSGGTIKLSNTTGLQPTSGYQLFVSINGGNNGGYAGKATGLGDLKLLCNPQPIEIGNRVWADRNRNGIQDATEVGIGNVSVVLYADFDQNGIPDGAALATVATNTTTGNLLGTYFFNETNVPDGDPTVVGNQVGLQPHKTYLVRIGSTSWSSGIGIGALASSKYLTTPNQTPTAGIQDEIDSDAISVSMIPTISVTTGSAGQNNHSLDFGFTTPVCGAPICLPVAITRQ